MSCSLMASSRSTVPFEILFQEALKGECLVISNSYQLRHFINHPNRNSIVEVNFSGALMKDVIEFLENEIDSLSIQILQLDVNLDDKNLKRILSKAGFLKLKKLILSYNRDITDETILNLANYTDQPLKLETLKVDITGVTTKGVETLACSEQFNALKELDLSAQYIKREAIISLAKPLAIPKLFHLKIGDNSIDDTVLPLFSQSSKFSHLRSLEFSYHANLSFQKLFVLCNRAPYSLRLRKLVLKGNRVSPKHIKLICRSEIMSQLQSLDLSGNNLDDKGICELHRAKFQNTLKHLFLARNRVSHHFLAELAKSKCYQNLETLDLVECPMTQSLRALSQKKKKPFQALYLSKLKSNDRELGLILSKNMKSLKKLKLSDISGVLEWDSVFQRLEGESELKKMEISDLNLGNHAIRTLLSQVKFPFLETLELRGKSEFNKETIEIICFSQKLPKLKYLALKDYWLNDAKLSCLKETKNFPLLRVLNLFGNLSVSSKCLKEIIESKNLPCLEVIYYGAAIWLCKY